jgi:hypothetical protein
VYVLCPWLALAPVAGSHDTPLLIIVSLYMYMIIYLLYLQIKDNTITNADLMVVIRTIQAIPTLAISFIDASVSE